MGRKTYNKPIWVHSCDVLNILPASVHKFAKDHPLMVDSHKGAFRVNSCRPVVVYSRVDIIALVGVDCRAIEEAARQGLSNVGVAGWVTKISRLERRLKESFSHVLELNPDLDNFVQCAAVQESFKAPHVHIHLPLRGHSHIRVECVELADVV